MICSSQRKSKVMMFFFIFIFDCGGISGFGGLVFFYFMYFVFSISPSDKLCFLVAIFCLLSV